MGNIQPYGRLKGRNHVGIYLFETISEQVFSASADCIENAAVRQSMQRHPFPRHSKKNHHAQLSITQLST